MELSSISLVPMCEAEIISREMKSGRNRPISIKCICSANDGYSEYVVKLIGDVISAERALIREIIGGLLAQAFGLPTPQVALINISTELAQCVNDEMRIRLEKSVGKNFGSKLHTNGYRIVTNPPYIPDEHFQCAVHIFAFDVLTQNPDRRIDKPNLLQNSELLMIDHELMFSSAFEGLSIGGVTNSWELSHKNPIIINHVLYKILKRKKDLRPEIESFCDLIFQITDKLLNEIYSRIPQEWRTPQASRDMQIIKSQLLSSAQNSHNFMRFLQEVLA